MNRRGEDPVAIVCSDLGQHDVRVLGTIRGASAQDTFVDAHPRAAAGLGYVLVGDGLIPAGHDRTPGDIPDAPPIPGMPGASWQFRCPSCPRTPRVTVDRFQALVDACRRAGRTQLDISRL